MGIILSNGDSFTYGDELIGSRDARGREYDTHHHYTYTHRLSEMLDKRYVNLGKNGSSNSKIYRETMQFLQTTSKKIDLLIITWTNWGRFEIANDFQLNGDKVIHIPFDENMNQIIPSHRSKHFIYDTMNDEIPERGRILKEYIEEVLTVQTQIVHGLSYMRNIQWMCDMLGIKVIQGIIHTGSYHNLLFTMRHKEGWEGYYKYVEDSLKYLRDECRLGLGRYIDIYSLADKVEGSEIRPGGHVCEKTQYAYAEMLYKITKDKGWFSVTD